MDRACSRRWRARPATRRGPVPRYGSPGIALAGAPGSEPAAASRGKVGWKARAESTIGLMMRLRDDRDRLPRLAVPQPNRVIATLAKPANARPSEKATISTPWYALLGCGAACRFAPPRASPCCHHSRWPVSRPADRTPHSSPPLVPFEGAEQLAASRLPELHRFVSTPAGQYPALRIKRHAHSSLCLRACGAACRFAPPIASPFRHHFRWPASRPAD